MGKQWLTLFFWGPKSLQMAIAAMITFSFLNELEAAAMKLKDTYSLEGKL